MLMRCLLLCLCLGWVCTVRGQNALNTALRESVHRVDVEVSDLYGKTKTQPVVITVFRPAGEMPAPLLILNHRRAIGSARQSQGRQRFVDQAKYFVAKGFVVMVPTRIGYGETYGAIDPEESDACRSPQLNAKNAALFKQMMAVHAFAQTQNYVDAKHWVVAGQSLGGYASVVTARLAPQGLVAAINFAGGYGGNPQSRRGNPCGAQAWVHALHDRGSTQIPPVLWVYWHNDWFWGDDLPQQWFEAFIAGGGRGQLHHLPALQVDGHGGFTRDMPGWMPRVDAFLNTLSLTLNPVEMPVALAVPAPTSFAPLAQVDRLPYLKATGRAGYEKFLSNPNLPRAFALNADGKWAYMNGYTDAMARTLEICNTGAKTPCRLYAVDHDVVWVEP